MKRWIHLAGTVTGVCVILVVLDSTMTTRNTASGRSEAEIVTLGAALESYNATHGKYPSNRATEELSPEHSTDPATYFAASQHLYRALSGDTDGDPETSSPEDHEPFFPFDTRKQMVRQAPQGGYYVIDPWGNSLGYSTLKAKHPETTAGHNPTFDLWSTSGGKRPKDRDRWIKNW